ncbi:MAG: MraY family glycosyltransferase [Thermodesulfobacteriota bacterium]
MILWLSAGTFLFSLVLTGLVRHYAGRARMIDHPNQRSSHQIPTPRGGGLAIIVSCCLVSLVLPGGGQLGDRLWLPLVLSGLPVALVGFVDDRGGLSARLRLAVHFGAAVLALALIGPLPALPIGELVWQPAGWPAAAAFVVILVWLINLNNFMDGIDGLAAMEAIFVCGGAALILLDRHDPLFGRPLLLAGASAGFLVWNWPPARIFMGDAGSGFLGLAIGILALTTSATGAISLWSWLILYAVFLVDATVTLLRRIVGGEKWYQAHRCHAYQILARRWQSHRAVTLTVLAINLCWLLPLAFFAARVPEYAIISLFVSVAPLVCGAVLVGAGKREGASELKAPGGDELC